MVGVRSSQYVNFSSEIYYIGRHGAGRGLLNYAGRLDLTPTIQERSVPIPDDTLALLQRLQVKSGGSLYVFVSLSRLRTISRHIESGALPAKMDLVNNLLRQFNPIQVQTRKLLAEKRRVKVEKIDWPLGCLHDLRRTFCTWTAETVKMSTLQKWAPHQDISTSARRRSFTATRRSTKPIANGKRWRSRRDFQDTRRTHLRVVLLRIAVREHPGQDSNPRPAV